MNEARPGPPDLVTRDARVSWHPYTQHALDPRPLPVVAARGAWLTLADGTRRLDAISSWWAVLHGHAHPPVVRAVGEQATRLDHVLFAGCTHEPAVAAAEALLALAPRGGRDLSRVFWSDDGSTAVEVALKMAVGFQRRRGHEERTGVLALAGGYHGDTFGAMSAGDPDPFFRDWEPMLFPVVRVPPDPAALEAAFARHGGRLAAVVLEPLVQGAAGMRFHHPEVVRTARRLCDRHGVLLVADEVMTFCRTGSVFACAQAEVVPDLLCVAKGLTGVLPLAATLATEEVYDAFRGDERALTFFHGHTFTANPIACAAAVASLESVVDESTPDRLARIGARIHEGVADLAGRPGVAEVRRKGGIVAVELGGDDVGYLAAAGDRLRALCRDEPEVLLRPLGNVLYALPPACLTDDEADLAAAALRRIALAAAAG